MINQLANFVFLAGTAIAHPGHGETSPFTLGHLLAEPEHAVWIAALFAGAVVFLALKRRTHGAD